MAKEYVFIYIHNLFSTRYSKQAEELARLHLEQKKMEEIPNSPQEVTTQFLSHSTPKYVLEILPLESGYESGGLKTVNYFLEHAINFIKSHPNDNINLVFDFNLGYSGFNFSPFPYIVAMLKRELPEKVSSIRFQLAGSGGGGISETINRELTQTEQDLVMNKLLIGINKEDLPKFFPDLNIKINMELIVEIANNLKSYNKAQIHPIQIPPRSQATIKTSETQKRKQNAESSTAPSNLAQNQYKFPLWNETNTIKRNNINENPANANKLDEDMTNIDDQNKKPKK